MPNLSGFVFLKISFDLKKKKKPVSTGITVSSSTHG